MKPVHRALLLGLAQVAIVASLGAKLAYDRATCPRVWVRTAPADPDLPMRGRYLELRLQAHVRGDARAHGGAVALRAEGGKLIAIPDPLAARPLGSSRVRAAWSSPDEPLAVLHPPVAFFLPEHARDPSGRPGEELWVEVTVPKRGPPRPIRLGMKLSSGPITPL